MRSFLNIKLIIFNITSRKIDIGDEIRWLARHLDRFEVVSGCDRAG